MPGERAFRKSFIKDFKCYENSRFGIEVLLNQYALKKKGKIKVVRFENVKNVYKMSKIGVREGLHSELKMAKEVLGSVRLFQIILQYIKIKLQNL